MDYKFRDFLQFRLYKILNQESNLLVSKIEILLAAELVSIILKSLQGSYKLQLFI